ncbi:MAG: hypothetical protein MJ067_04345 [Oscillospiraceae bacterium]|nr:hypothetical protein [Oscillospiraceae bacterium]
MNAYFDIFGTPIPFKEIKEFRLVQREYIYRPVYEEYTVLEKSFLTKTITRKYRYVTMAPYAAIVDESDRRWIFSGKGKDFKENIGVELINDLRETVGDKLKIKAIKGKRYLCMNQTGRTFQVYLDEIPVLVQMEDGRPIEIDKDNPLFMALGEANVPAIDIVPALLIKAKEDYIFWGNGIQLKDIESEYRRLQIEMTEFKQGGTQKLIEKKRIAIPKLPKFVKKGKSDSESVMNNSEPVDQDN